MIFVSTKKGRTTNFFHPSLLLLCFGSGIRDPWWTEIRIRDKHTRSATLLFSMWQTYIFSFADLRPMVTKFLASSMRSSVSSPESSSSRRPLTSPLPATTSGRWSPDVTESKNDQIQRLLSTNAEDPDLHLISCWIRSRCAIYTIHFCLKSLQNKFIFFTL